MIRVFVIGLEVQPISDLRNPRRAGWVFSANVFYDDGGDCRKVAAAKAAGDWTGILYPRHSRVGGNPTAMARS